MSAITAKASRKMKKYAVLTREPRCFLGSFDFSWEQRKLGDISEIKTGPFGSTLHADDYVSDGTPIITTEHFKTGTLPRSKNGLPQVSDADYKRLTAYTLDDGDIVFSRVGSVDINALITPFQSNWLFSGRVLRVRPQTNISSQFLHTRLETGSIKADIRARAVGQTMPSINTEILKITPLVLPTSAAEQEQIGSYFAAIDNLITLHQRKCALLFSSFQALISMMFTTSTFSWEQRKLGDIGETYTGLSGKTKADFGHGQARFVTYMNVFSNPISNPEMTEPIEIDPKQNEVEVGDVFFTTSSETPEEVGMSSVLLEKRGKTYLNSFCFGFRPSEKIDSYYLAYMLRSESAREKIILLAQGISRYNISKNKVMEIAVSLPSLDEQKLIGQYFRQLDNLITLHQRKCISFTGRAGRLISTVNKKRITSSWEQRKLGELVDRVVRKNTNNESTLPLTISAQYGLVDQITYFNNRVASRDVSNYYLVLNGEFAYNKSTSDGYPFGAVKRLDLYEKGVLSTLYIVFSPKKEQQIDSDFLTVFFDTDRWHKGVAERAAEGARNHGLLNISAEDFFDIDLSVPKDVAEQKQIGAFIRQLDHLITLHQRKPFLMKWRTSDANRNQTNRLVL